MNKSRQRVLSVCVVLLSLLFFLAATSWAAPFVDNLDETVTDAGTGLMWQQADDGMRRDWAEAVAYCESLELGDYDDWRAPRIDELETIIDFSRYDPAIAPVFSAQSDVYWSSSTYADFDGSHAWRIYFYNGYADFDDKSNRYYVRCVRGGPYWPLDPSSNYQSPSPPTVLDTYWGYMWQKGDNGEQLSWDQANAYCNGLDLNGQSDWRLPEIEALLKITNYKIYDPALGMNFDPRRPNAYWSSSTKVYYSNSAWYVNFYNGYANSSNKVNNKKYVRCVRGGPGSLLPLTLDKAGTGTGRVTSEPARIDCGTDCISQTASFAQLTYVVLTAQAGTGSQFTGWSGACSGAGDCAVNVLEELNVTATFIKEQPPNQLPQAICQDVTVAAGQECTANASIDNSSFDPDGDPITLSQSPPGPYPLGITPAVLTVTDSKGASSQCASTVTVVDNTPPPRPVTWVNPSVLWPANGAMVDVTLSYNATDNCGQATCQVSTVTSNEPISSSDYAVLDVHHVKLRAERLGHGNGRIYTIFVTCTDTSGNSSNQSVMVTVPHDQGSNM